MYRIHIFVLFCFICNHRTQMHILEYILCFSAQLSLTYNSNLITINQIKFSIKQT